MGRGEGIGGLCSVIVTKTGTDGGGVSVWSSRGTPVSVHATDVTSQTIEDLQFTLGEGPCVDAAASGQPVFVPDLAAAGGDLTRRWLAFLAEIAQTPARALFAFPIRIEGVGLGILDLYRRTPGRLDGDQVKVGLSGVEALGSRILTDAASDAGPDVGTYPLSVHRAAGMVMVQLDTTLEDALVRLRATAYIDGVLVTALALDVIEGRRRFTSEDT